ncbi:MAG: hypothetical protein K2K98_10885 [Muribaculaceae bacterium]|nr:hypothetical protein [Muribaculaceae bacterium]
MKIPEYHSIENIKKQYCTGEEPVLALCSDLNEYVCKYMRSSSTPYKLICEIIGAISANIWELKIPDFALVKLLPEHWTPFRNVNLSAPAFGSKIEQTVIDVSSTWNNEIIPTSAIQQQIAKIALFDIWMANEDRNWNNANMLYDVTTNELLVIDHGCILNTATFDFDLSLLTQNETILYSDLAHFILSDISDNTSNKLIFNLEVFFKSLLDRREEFISCVLDNIPVAWNVNLDLVRFKLNQLFEKKWIENCWETFVEYYNESKNG